ncbi:MAG: hypothetical protein ACK4P3_08535 [Fimbriimonadaceae bacterium]
MKKILAPLAVAGIVFAAATGMAQQIETIWAQLPGAALRIDASTNNQFIAGQVTGGVRIYNAATMSILTTVPSSGTVNDISISAHGNLVAISTSGTGNNVCRVHSTQSGALVATLASPGTGGISVARFSPNLTGPQHLAMGNATNSRRVRVYSSDAGGNFNWDFFTDFGDQLDLNPVGIGWNATGTKFVAAYNTTLTPRSAIFELSSPGAPVVIHNAPNPNLSMSSSSSASMSPDGNTVVITGGSGFALYSGTAPDQIGSTTAGLSAVRDARFIDNTNGFLIRSNNEIRNYSNSGDLSFTYTGPASATYLSRVTQDGRFYATGTGGPVFRYQVGTATPDVFVFGLQGSPRSIGISPNGQWLVSAPIAVFNNARVFNTSLGVVASVIEFPNGEDRGNDFAFSPDSNTLYIQTRPWQGAELLARVTRWNPATGASAGSDFLPAASGTDPENFNGGISVSPDGELLAFLNGFNRVLTIFNTSDGSIYSQSAPLPGTSVTNVRFTPDGNSLILATRGPDGNNAIRRVPVTPSVLIVAETAELPSGIPSWLAVAPNGQFAIVRTQTQLVRFELSNLNAPPSVLGGNFALSSDSGFVDISPDSSMVVSAASITGIAVRNTLTGANITISEDYGTVIPVRFSPTGSQLGFVNSNGGVYYASMGSHSGIGGTIFWEGPNSGPLPRLMVGWRTSAGSVVLPTVVIDAAPADWQVRTVGTLVPGTTDSLVWQNTDPNFSIPGLVAYWNLASSGAPWPGGTGGAPPSIDWQVRAFRDLNGDGVSDILWFNTATDQVAIWYRNAGGNVIGTAVVGGIPAGWQLVTAGTENRLFFQNTDSSLVAYWTLDNAGAVTGTATVGLPGAEWVLQGFGRFNIEPALLFRNTNSNQLAYWDISPSGSVIGTGTLGEAPAGWFILGVGRL